MMLQLLLAVAILHVTSASSFDACPNNSVCLYFARCRNANASVLATTNPLDFNDWESNNCDESSDEKTQLFVQQLSDNEWNFTLNYSEKKVAIGFGHLLTMKANETQATFLNTLGVVKKLTYQPNGKNLIFTVSDPGQYLLNHFYLSQIVYTDEKGTTNHNIPDFWKRLGPCDQNQIVDCCSVTVNNCTKLEITRDAVKCQAGYKMWMHDNSDWMELEKVTCDANKDWQLTSNGTMLSAQGGTIQCAVEKPEPSSTDPPAVPTDKPTPTEPTVPVPDEEDKESSDESEDTNPEATTDDDNEASSILHTFALPIVLFFACM